MEIIATAKPNRKYRWYRCLQSVTLESRSQEGRIYYYEVDAAKGKERRMNEDAIKCMFRVDHSIKDQPFLAKENRSFYAILYRHLKEFQEQFESIKLKANLI